jgi:hypothetical protein
VVNLPTHPHWCDPARCTAAGDGPHESAPTTVRVGRTAEPSRVLLLLWAPGRAGRPTKLRMVVISDMLVNSIDFDLDSAHLTMNTIGRLLALARPPERTGPVPTPEDPPND